MARPRIHHFNEKAFDEIKDEHTAYWLGFIYADGYVNKKGLQIALSTKDRLQLERIQAFMGGNVPIRGYVKERYELAFHSQRLASKLKKLGVIPRRGNFSLTKKFIPVHLQKHFIRGYVDGDGCLANDERIIILGQEDILSWIMNIFHNELGTNKSKIRQRRGISEMSIGGREQAWKIIGYLYINATIFMDRKFLKVKQWKFPNRRKKSSQYIGVSLFKRTGRWSAKVKHNGKENHIGYFDNELEAAKARDKLALELQGSSANLNFPQ